MTAVSMMVMVVLDDHEVFLGDNQFFTVDLAKNLWLQYFGRRAGGDPAAVGLARDL